MVKFKNLTVLSYVFVFLGLLFFGISISTTNTLFSLLGLTFSYLAVFIYHYIHYKFTGDIKWFSIISYILLGIILLFFIL